MDGVEVGSVVLSGAVEVWVVVLQESKRGLLGEFTD